MSTEQSLWQRVKLLSEAERLVFFEALGEEVGYSDDHYTGWGGIHPPSYAAACFAATEEQLIAAWERYEQHQR